MGIEKWQPRVDTSPQEDRLLKRLAKKRKLFGFLRRHRHRLFDDAFQADLAGMYRQTGAGKEPVTPALMAMACLLQGYTKMSDADSVEMTVVDLRWQLVLDCLGSSEPAFSQGAFRGFRERLIAHDMDRRLLERTVELAEETGEFDPRKLPKSLRLAVDSSPLLGAGRVEDTINLIAHAARIVVTCAARLTNTTEEAICKKARTPLFVATSTKAGLDVNWEDAEEAAQAVPILVEQVEALVRWINVELPEAVGQVPLSEHIDTLRQLITQDLEPDPSGNKRVRRGVAKERRVSVRDPEMRHGRKSRTKAFDGYKRHIARDLDSQLIRACALTPANRPEGEAVPALKADLDHQHVRVDELNIDRAYIKTELARDVFERTRRVISRPWPDRRGQLFPKSSFEIDLQRNVVRCPMGAETSFTRLGQTVHLPAERCESCEYRTLCTAAKQKGRSLHIAADEPLQQHLRRIVNSKQGRAKLRERVDVEHGLAHIGQRQGNKARYTGTRRNLFDLRRASAIQNLETVLRDETRKAA
jgi:hypothetical protein